MPFTPATREKAKLKMAILGPEKSGKTYTALKIMRAMVGPEGRIAVIDTEHGSASKYVGEEPGFQFDVEEPASFHPTIISRMINEAVAGGYHGLIIDSLSHEWNGLGGCLETVDQVSKQNKGGNSYFAWGEVTPHHSAMLTTIVRSPIHVICTLRVKTEYVLQEYVDNGKTKQKPVKVGMGPVQRDGVGYEFDILMDMDRGVGYIDHTSRCSAIKHLVVEHPGAELAGVIKEWLDKGKEPALARMAEGGTFTEPPPVKQETLTRAQEPPKPATGETPPRPAVPPPPKPVAPGSRPQAGAQSSTSVGSAPTPGAAAAPKPLSLAPSAPGGNGNGPKPVIPGSATPVVPTGTGATSGVADAQADQQPAGQTGLKGVLDTGTMNGWDRAAMSAWILNSWPQLQGKNLLEVFTVGQARAATLYFKSVKPPVGAAR